MNVALVVLSFDLTLASEQKVNEKVFESEEDLMILAS